MDLTNFIKHPSRSIKSLLFSLRYTPRNWWKLPISASWITKIKCSKGSIISVNGKLSLGILLTRVGEIGQINYDRTIIQLDENSELAIDGKVSLGPGVRIITGKYSTVKIGDKTFISSNSLIISRQSIEIGSNCAISWDVQIMDTDFHSLTSQQESTKPITIGDNVWIGSRVTVLKGVNIGSGSVIGAGTVVTKDVPPNSLVAGNPARVIRENVKWSM